jgi:hypothetical protein
MEVPGLLLASRSGMAYRAGPAIEIHEVWLETHRYLDMEALAEQRKTQLHDLELTAAYEPPWPMPFDRPLQKSLPGCCRPTKT